MRDVVYALDSATGAKVAGAVGRVQGQTREGYNVTPLDGFESRAPDATGVSVEITGPLGTGSVGYGLYPGLLRIADTAATPPTWYDGETVWVLPVPDASHNLGEVIGNARCVGTAPDGVPVFTGATQCCGWSADYWSYNQNPFWGPVTNANVVSHGVSAPGWTGTGGGASDGNNLSCRSYLTWLAPPFWFTAAKSGREVTVPANENHWVDAQILVAVRTTTLKPDGLGGVGGDYDVSALGYTTHRCQLVYAEAALVDIEGFPTVVQQQPPFLPVLRGQVVMTPYGMVPVGDRVPSWQAGFDWNGGSGGFMRGGDNAPLWGGTARTRLFKGASPYPFARRLGWVLTVWYDSSWTSVQVSWQAQLWTQKVCCGGTAPQAPGLSVPPPPPTPPLPPPGSPSAGDGDGDTSSLGLFPGVGFPKRFGPATGPGEG